MSADRNIKLVLAFDGTQYSGWQRQKEQPTIQGAIEDRLRVMTGEAVTLYGASRTDAGVHALGMVANFHTGSKILCAGFQKGLNSLLPGDIRVLAAEDVDRGFHARFDAQAKTYIYKINNEPVQQPTDRLYAAHVAGGLDLEAMRACLPSLVGEHDFSSFEAVGSRDHDEKGGRGAVRKIFAAAIEKRGLMTGRIDFIITGDGFLRHMVRNVAGTLIYAGQGRLTADDFRSVLAAGKRSAAGPTAPARGLFLQEVLYRPYKQLDKKTEA